MGFGNVNEIIAILDEIPLRGFKLEIGLKLRQAMLLNGMLYNSEAWHAVSEVELRQLEAVDEHLLRKLVNMHFKTPRVPVSGGRGTVKGYGPTNSHTLGVGLSPLI